MKNHIRILFIFLFTCMTSHELFSEEALGYLIRKDDSSKILIYTTTIEMTGDLLYYYDATLKKKQIPQKKIQYLEAGQYKLINLPFYKNGGWERLHRIVAFSKDYYLTTYYSKGHFSMFIFDKDYKMVVENIYYHKQYSAGGDKGSGQSKALAAIKEYFPNCQPLIDRVVANIDRNFANFTPYDYKDILGDINNYKCE